MCVCVCVVCVCVCVCVCDCVCVYMCIFYFVIFFHSTLTSYVSCSHILMQFLLTTLPPARSSISAYQLVALQCLSQLVLLMMIYTKMMKC